LIRSKAVHVQFKSIFPESGKNFRTICSLSVYSKIQSDGIFRYITVPPLSTNALELQIIIFMMIIAYHNLIVIFNRVVEVLYSIKIDQVSML